RAGVQIGDVRGAERIGEGAADGDVRGDLPANAALAGDEAAEGVVGTRPNRAGELELVEAGHVLEERRVDLEEAGEDVVTAAGWGDRGVEVVARRLERIRRECGILAVELRADGETDRAAARDIEELPGQRALQDLLLVRAALRADVAHVVQHVLRDGPGAVE